MMSTFYLIAGIVFLILTIPYVYKYWYEDDLVLSIKYGLGVVFFMVLTTHAFGVVDTTINDYKITELKERIEQLENKE